MPHPKTQLIKVWDDWSDGMGYLIDDGRTNGFYFAEGLLCSSAEIRPAPGQNLSSQAVTNATAYQYWFSEADADGDVAIYGVRKDSTNAGHIDKFDGRQSTFMTLIATHATVSAVAGGFGRPARYQGNWYIGAGTDAAGSGTLYELTTVGDISAATADTWSTGVPGESHSHLTLLNMQLAEIRRGEGISILKVDGAPLTAADWGSEFQAGDKNEIPQALAGTAGLAFVLNKDGLYSFNNRGRSGAVFTDFGGFRSALHEAALIPWHGGLLIGHPTGLLFYEPGQRPVSIGVESRARGLGNPPAELTSIFEVTRGRYHGVEVVGDTVYALYQVNPPSNTSAIILVGKLKSSDDPTSIAWQGLDRVTLDIGSIFSGLGFVANATPEATAVANPVLLSTQQDDAVYYILDAQGSPFRARNSSHLVTAGATMYFSEYRLPITLTPTHLVVYTADFTSADELRLSLIADGDATARSIGAVIKGNGRHERTFERHDFNRFMLKLVWSTSDVTSRAAPSIRRIELYGRPI